MSARPVSTFSSQHPLPCDLRLPYSVEHAAVWKPLLCAPSLTGSQSATGHTASFLILLLILHTPYSRLRISHRPQPRRPLILVSAGHRHWPALTRYEYSVYPVRPYSVAALLRMRRHFISTAGRAFSAHVSRRPARQSRRGK